MLSVMLLSNLELNLKKLKFDVNQAYEKRQKQSS